MRRWLRIVACCLVFGAIANVIVAWWITATDDSQWTYGGINGPPDDAQVAWWVANAPRDYPSVPGFVASKSMFGVWTEELCEDVPLKGLWRHPVAERRRAGWPFATLEGHKWCHPMDGALNAEVGVWHLFSDRPWLPLQPMWPGFVANTLFFGLLPFLPIALFVMTRRVLRSRRHQCLRCGYPVGVSPVCTECGHAVSRQIAG
jgi:hypothetical protein